MDLKTRKTIVNRLSQHSRLEEFLIRVAQGARNIRFSSEEKLAKMAKAVIGLDNFGGSGYIVIFKLFKILIIC